MEANDHLNEEVAAGIKQYLTSGQYPAGLDANQKRNFRKRAKDFVVSGDSGSPELYYRSKKDGSLRLSVSCNEDKLRIFHVQSIAYMYRHIQYVATCERTLSYVQECHADPTGGHLGRTKTNSKIKARFYWPNQYIDVDNLVGSCVCMVTVTAETIAYCFCVHEFWSFCTTESKVDKAMYS